MITCCEIALVLGLTNVISLAIFAGYTVHWKERTLKLEKKNGAEQHQIDQLKQEFKKEIQDLKNQLKETQRGNKN